MKYYSTFKRKGILPFATTWMDLEDIMLSDIIRHRKTNSVCYHLYVESKKIKQKNEHNKTKTDSQI